MINEGYLLVAKVGIFFSYLGQKLKLFSSFVWHLSINIIYLRNIRLTNQETVTIMCTINMTFEVPGASPELLSKLDEARKEIREGNGITLHSQDEINAFFESL